jgi:hypothetical protein
MNIRVHIERLVVEGIELAPADGPVLQEAIQAELGRLLAAQTPPGVLERGGTVPVKTAGPIHLEANQTPVFLGKQIAQAVFEGLKV